jgi:hypothetical protein
MGDEFCRLLFLLFRLAVLMGKESDGEDCEEPIKDAVHDSFKQGDVDVGNFNTCSFWTSVLVIVSES